MKHVGTFAVAAAAFAAAAPAPTFQAEAQTDSIYLCQEHETTFRDSRTNGISLDALRELELATRTRCPNLNARVNARLSEPVRSTGPTRTSTPATATASDVCRTQRSVWSLWQATGTAAQVSAFRDQLPGQCSELRNEVTTFYEALRRGGPRPTARSALPPTTGSGPLGVDEARQGELTAQEARSDGRVWDDYRLRLDANQSVEIRLNSEEFDAFLEVGLGDGDDFRALASNDDGGGGLNSLVRYQAIEASTFTVRARALGGRGTGPYRLEVREANLTPPPEARRIAFGQARAGVLSDGEARAFDDGNQLYDLYSFTAQAGQRVRLSMDAADVNGRLAFDTMLVVGRIRDGAFQRLASNDDHDNTTNSLIHLLIPEDGEYLVRAQAYSSNGAGEYEIRLDVAPERPAPAPVSLPDRPNATVYLSALTNDMPVVRNQTYYQDFSFRARQGRRYVIELTSPVFEPYLEIGEAGGQAFEALASSDERGSAPNSARISFDAPRNGAFIIRARSYSDGATGEFEVTIAETGRADQ